MANFVDVILYISLFILISFNCFSFCDDEYEGIYTLVLEHSFGSEQAYSKRGTIRVHSLKSGRGEYIPETLLSDEEISQLRKLAEKDGVYRLRVGRITTDETVPTYIHSFIKACSLYESGLSDKITIHIDSSGSLIGASVTTTIPYCSGAYLDNRSSSSLSGFNTSVEVQQTVAGPAPETETFIKKLELEKQQAKGQQADNRSFFAKYWMYIVPFFIFVMLANNVDPGAAQGTGGAR